MVQGLLRATMVGLETRLLRFSFLCKLQDMGDKWPRETERSDLRPGNLTLNTGLSCDIQAQGQQTETPACIYVRCGSGASQDWRGVGTLHTQEGGLRREQSGGPRAGKGRGRSINSSNSHIKNENSINRNAQYLFESDLSGWRKNSRRSLWSSCQETGQGQTLTGEGLATPLAKPHRARPALSRSQCYHASNPEFCFYGWREGSMGKVVC